MPTGRGDQRRQAQRRQREPQRRGRVIDAGRRAARTQWEPVADHPRRSRELRRFADAQQVAAFQQGGDRLALDRGGIGIALGVQRAKNRLGQAKVGKIGHEVLTD